VSGSYPRQRGAEDGSAQSGHNFASV